jgi:DNA-binding beta-propeller fold protein YncE
MMLSLHRALPLLILVLLAPIARATDIYFADTLNFFDPQGNSVRRIAPDGTGLTTIVQTGPGLRSLDLDVQTGKVFWTDADNGLIRRANINGNGAHTVLTSPFPSAIRIDHASGKMYWGDQSTGELRRANLDGTASQLIAGGSFYRGLALDVPGGEVYWTTSDTATSGRIVRANLDGTGQEDLISSPEPSFKPTSIALDKPHSKIYWTDSVTAKVRRANLDGTGVEDIFDSSALGSPRGIAVDSAAGKIYWGQDIDNEGATIGEIHTASLDGSNHAVVASGLGSVNDIVLLSGKRAVSTGVRP